MNRHDRGNLQFLLSASEKTLRDWYESASDDDLAYAQELFRAARSELTLRALEIIDSDAITDLEPANQILKQFTLVK